MDVCLLQVCLLPTAGRRGRPVFSCSTGSVSARHGRRLFRRRLRRQPLRLRDEQWWRIRDEPAPAGPTAAAGTHVRAAESADGLWWGHERWRDWSQRWSARGVRSVEFSGGVCVAASEQGGPNALWCLACKHARPEQSGTVFRCISSSSSSDSSQSNTLLGGLCAPCLHSFGIIRLPPVSWVRGASGWQLCLLTLQHFSVFCSAAAGRWWTGIICSIIRSRNYRPSSSLTRNRIKW